MNESWKQRFLEVMHRNDAAQEEEFLSLVDEVKNRCTLGVAQTLMRSFLSKPDYGTQERVVSVLASADRRDTLTAILAELPRLIKEAPEWAEVLVGQEVDRRPELLAEVARNSPSDSVDALRRLLSSQDFQNLYPNAKRTVTFIPF